MFIIYKITNLLNNKVYIGQTSGTIEKRFKQHKNKSRQEYKNRPLYDAFNKYGMENFFIQEIEKVSTKDLANQRQQFWIKKYNSFGNNGYNATIGGDCGSSFKKEVVQIDPNTFEILNIFESTREAGRFLNKPNAHISAACLKKRQSAYGFLWAFKNEIQKFQDISQFFNLSSIKNNINNHQKYNKILQIDPNTNKVIASFSSCREAGEKLNINPDYIRRVCKGVRQTTGGFKWKNLGL